MNYSQEDFIELIEAVEEQGGTHLDEDCAKKVVLVKKRVPRGKTSRFALARCGNASLFEIPYELEDTGTAGEVGIIRVCAVDDNVGAWPRFNKPQEEPDDGES